MKLQIEMPTHLIVISRLDLDKIEKLPNGGLLIGVLGQLRNKATTAGNLLQKK